MRYLILSVRISPSMPYREARSVAESGEGPTGSKRDRTGRNPGMTRFGTTLQRHVWRYYVFSLFQTFRQRMRKCSGSPIPSLATKLRCCMVFSRNWHFSWFYRHKRNVRTVRVWEVLICRRGRLKCAVVNIAFHEWSCLSDLSVNEFQDLPIQFGQVLNSKNFNRCGILLVGLGGPTHIKKKTMKWQLGVFSCHGMAEFAQNSFWAAAQNRKNAHTPYSKMAAILVFFCFHAKLALMASLSNVKFKRIFILEEGHKGQFAWKQKKTKTAAILE